MSSEALSEWFRLLRLRLDGETPGQHVARIVRAFCGVSLLSERDKLIGLFEQTNETERAAPWVAMCKTNCGTFARSALCLAGARLEEFVRAYAIQMAVAWVLDGARKAGALRGPDFSLIGPGVLLHYAGAHPNDDHLEFALSAPDASGCAQHAGAGRANNAITLEHGDLRFSACKWGLRPLRHVIVPDDLCREPWASHDNPY